MDYTNALNLAGAENQLANDFINQTLDLSTALYLTQRMGKQEYLMPIQ